MDKRELSAAFLDALREFNDLSGGFSSAMGAGGRGGGGGFDFDRETSDYIKNLKAALKEQTDASRNLTKEMREEEKARDANNYELDREIDYREKNNIALDATLNSRKREREAIEARVEQDRALKDSTKKSVDAFKSLGDAILNTEKSFSKYGGAVQGAGDALASFAGKFGGPWGKAIELAIKGVTALNVAILKQTDSVLKQADDLAKFGAAGQLTTKEILGLAHQAGYTSKTMEGLFKASKSLGTDILALGGNVTEGTKAFGKVAERNDKVLEGFRKLGFSQEEFTQAQANSIKLMTQQGVIITKEMKDRGDLVKSSQAYAENLTVLSALTGQTRDQMEKRLEQENAAFNVQAKQSQMAVEILSIEEKLKTASGSEREELQKTLKSLKGMQESFTAAQGEVSEFLSPDQLKAFKEISSTGTITSQTGASLNQQLGGQGVELIRAVTEAKSREEYDRAMARFQAQLGKGAITTAQRYGRTAAFDEEGARALGFTERTTKQISSFGGKTEEEILATRLKTRADVEATKRGEGKVGEDPAQRARAFVETTERTIGVALDKAVDAINPFTSGLTVATGLFGALNIALLAATARLGALGIGGMFGRGAAASSALGTGASIGGKILSTGGKIAAGGIATLAGGAIMDAGSSYAKSKGHEGVAKGLDVGSSALSGAGIGATIGSIIPGVGTMVGAGVGGALGAGYGLYKNYFGNKESEELPQGKKEGEPPTEGTPPGAATGGILSGPKSGFPAILHGTEAVIPLNGKSIPIEFKGLGGGLGGSEAREEKELKEKNVKGVADNNDYLKKLTTTIMSLDKTLKKQLEIQEDLEDELIKGQIDGTGDSGKTSTIDKIKQFFGGKPGQGGDPNAPIQYSKGKPFEGNRKEFTDKMYNTLLEQAKKAGVANPEVIAKLGTAQSTIETGYGKHLAGGQNYFGIKDFSKGGGKNIQQTKEVINGREVTINDAFRRYGSMEESAADYVQFLLKNPRYAQVLKSQNPEEAAMAIRRAGYATDPQYASKLMSVMSRMEPGPKPDEQVAASKAPAPVPPKPSAETGGILSGPTTGYDALLHGREAVVPLSGPREEIAKNLDALKERVATDTSSSISSSPLPTPSMPSALPAQDNYREMMEMFTQIIAAKFDEMLDKMGEANDIAGQQLRAIRT